MKFTTIECRFHCHNNTRYTYLAPVNVKVGDYAVVHVERRPGDPEFPFITVEVTKVHKKPIVNRDLKWIVQRIDTKEYRRRQKLMAQALGSVMQDAYARVEKAK